MIHTFIRKFNQLRADPVLRAWLIGRAFGKWSSAPSITAYHPAYLDEQLPLTLETPSAQDANQVCAAKKPNQPVEIELPGEKVILPADNPAHLFERTFSDIETQLGAHRFAWLDIPESEIDVDWTTALWTAWSSKYGADKTGWAWHPYTTAERAINIINFSTHYGWPGDTHKTRALLAAHAPVIAHQLEYFGETNTSNHLANNGRGLFIIGATLGLPHATRMGIDILLHEAERIFMPSGILREGSTHYHALYARRYKECAALAKKQNIAGADKLHTIASRAMSVLSRLNLPGGLPMIGDISPDIAPEYLLKMMNMNPSTEPMDADGWLRIDLHDWHGLWHSSPDGWSQMPGHGHQDTGSFELHWKNERVIVDPGRGKYGEIGEAALYRSAAAHNTLTINGQDPYPPNKPYYTNSFRQSICGLPPTLTSLSNGARLQFDGYTRLGNGRTVIRDWKFDETTITITDCVSGTGRADTRRQFITPLPTEIIGDGVVLTGSEKSFRIRSTTKPTTEPITIWHAYGQGRPATAVIFDDALSLPWQSNIVIEAI